eukprot:3832568-Pleurochrysis_carterae.AAC.1
MKMVDFEEREYAERRDAYGLLAHGMSSLVSVSLQGLDVNWRNVSGAMGEFYDYPSLARFPNFTKWFAFLRAHRLRTYFNDHPFPVASRGAGGLQTSPEEIAFRSTYECTIF